MSLSQSQIDHLFKFVRSKYVRYYDVQLELVDHLASDIEKEIIEHPGLSFEQALHKVYGRWPITGFSNYIAEKQHHLNQYWKRRFWNHLKQYFKLPKIILTLLVTFLLFQFAKVSIEIWAQKINALILVFILMGIKAYIDLKVNAIPYPKYGNEKLLSHTAYWQQIL